MPDSGIEMTVPKAEPAYVKDVNLREVEQGPHEVKSSRNDMR